MSTTGRAAWFEQTAIGHRRPGSVRASTQKAAPSRPRHFLKLTERIFERRHLEFPTLLADRYADPGRGWKMESSRASGAKSGTK
tara:strand:+ start:9934 stop:10185 length:252 start_codon:yes stop_codon:yes gene_type:complete